MMKKITLLMAVAGLAMVSCSEDEPVSINQGNAIEFRPAIGSRASEVTNANLSEITVAAFIGDTVTPYFDDVVFTKGNDGFFTSARTYNWLGDTTNLTFFAYSPTMDELGADVVMTGSQKELQNFTVAENIADQVDFITSTATGNKAKNEASGVELTFKHQLSQIEICAKSENPTYTFKVTGARIGRAETTGTFNFTDSEWTLDSWHDTAIYETSCDEVTLTDKPVSIMGTAGNAMLIPQSLTPWSPTGDPDNVAREAYLSVLVNISTTDGGTVVYPFPSDKKNRTYAWASIPLKDTWEAGKKYVYVLDFTLGAGYVDPDDPTPGNPVLGGPIKFTVNVENWTDDDNIPVSMEVK